MDNQLMELVERTVQFIDSKHGEDISVLDISKISSICDYFIIASGSSVRQVKSISDEVEDQLAKLDVLPRHKEGYFNGRWILLDYGDIVIHLFHEEDRAFYNLERIWKDGSIVNIDKIVNNNI
ncbi:ribosome silencing factor [Alkaliphilus peptidifermentans]|uniref:Ribosomal silencing factor RsfS n=1 Tax=Alkaliphilus peptidifermentans DSM 18978 TaxID=1120976 RepID=A0A1G5J722_9FIRM|nr:ribosome silencing factor [Alkaliphilus peptidifermentans]SCY84173.1 ribosome-associated protein [Alkaliphilus peptidifermentans DSM 18978]